jgi:hypothetical protein
VHVFTQIETTVARKTALGTQTYIIFQVSIYLFIYLFIYHVTIIMNCAEGIKMIINNSWTLFSNELKIHDDIFLSLI